jgi:acyl dehydratase
MTRLAESLSFEDVDLASAYETRAHRVTADDLVRFGELTHDRHPLHTDDAFARSMGFPGRIAHGLFSLALAEGLKAEIGLYETTSVASLGWDEVRFRKPVVVGDMLRTRVTFLSKRPSRQPERGVVVEQVELLNQHGEVVLSAKHATLLVCRDVAAGGGGDAGARTKKFA